MLRPQTSAIHLWFSGYERMDRRFTGRIQVPGGIERVQTYLFDPGDTYTSNGDTIEFNISSLISQPLGTDILGPSNLGPSSLSAKHMLITPAPGADRVNINVTVDGEITRDRFFPYGNNVADSTGSASIGLDDFPIVPALPISQGVPPDSIILWGIRGIDSEEPASNLDPETIEQLRAIGYLH